MLTVEDDCSERDSVASHTRAKPELWWIGSLILLATSLLGFGKILWSYYGAGS
jgi:hypothetical protein